MKKPILLLSCEHASAEIPPLLQEKYPELKQQHELNYHFSDYDPYAAELTISIANALKAEYLLGKIGRSILDLNKNYLQDHCFSEWSRQHLSTELKEQILQQYYFQYRDQFKMLIEKNLTQGMQVMHLSIHSFHHQELSGLEHNAAIGILYDSLHHGEKEVARIWNELLTKRTPYRVRLNYPRSGKADNFTSYLRKQYSEADYLGLELECNALILEDSQTYQEFSEQLVHSIFSLIELL